MLKNHAENEYGDFPSYRQIENDLNELLTEVKSIHTVEKAKEFAKKYNWITLEINGDLLTEDTPDDLDVEWVRYEHYGCLDYIYVRTDGDIYFDVWSDLCYFDFIDSIRVCDLTEEYVIKAKDDALFFLKNRRWK